ncbi:hypothetical protein FM107_15190 [Sphingobacterium sp. JB170]|nr:hypothetical protein FM107_15190 [Sphingobacterium sp. JB170]
MKEIFILWVIGLDFLKRLEKKIFWVVFISSHHYNNGRSGNVMRI